MNIFYLDKMPTTCASYHCDRHTVKMLLEYAQILSTAHHVLDTTPPPKIYKPAYINHPSTKWARSSDSAYIWLFDLFKALHSEFLFRYSHWHSNKRLLPLLVKPPANIQQADFQPPPLCMPDQYKQADAIKAYQDFYRQEKASFLTYTKTAKPYFL